MKAVQSKVYFSLRTVKHHRQNCQLSTYGWTKWNVVNLISSGTVRWNTANRSEWISVNLVGSVKFKGTVHPKIKNTFSAVNQSRLFCCELSSFGDIGRRDFSKTMGLIGALKMWQSYPPTSWKTQQQCLTMLHKIIHRPCCEQFHVGTTFLLNGTTFLPT